MKLELEPELDSELELEFKQNFRIGVGVQNQFQNWSKLALKLNQKSEFLVRVWIGNEFEVGVQMYRFELELGLGLEF